MITPMEIQTKVFDKAAIGGYNKEDVDNFIEFVLTDYETLYKASIESEQQLKILTQQLETYKGMEETMKNSILVAQQTAENVQKNANEKAQLIISEAELKAKEIIENANKSVENSMSELTKIQHAMDIYKCQAISMLNAQIENLRKFETMPK